MRLSTESSSGSLKRETRCGVRQKKEPPRMRLSTESSSGLSNMRLLRRPSEKGAFPYQTLRRVVFEGRGEERVDAAEGRGNRPFPPPRCPVRLARHQFVGQVVQPQDVRRRAVGPPVVAAERRHRRVHTGLAIKSS